MYSRSVAFDAAVRTSGTVVVSADVLYAGTVLVSGLPVLAGSVEVDGTASVRRRCSFDVADKDGTLTNGTTAPLSPYGNEVVLRRGLLLPSGAVEVVTIGTFRISTVRANNSGTSRTVSVAGFDRSRAISRARFETPYTVAAGTNYATAIAELLRSRFPGVPTQFAATNATTPLLVFDQAADPWETAMDMATSIGCLLYFDPTGVCILTPATDATTVVWDYGAGVNAVVLAVDDTLDDEPGYNGVVVDGEPADLPPVHAVVYDNDPASPTYSLGPYGKVPRFYKSPFITTTAQATAAASGILLQARGMTESLSFEAIPHPAHEVDDLVRVADPNLGIDSNYYLESFTIPLDMGTMTCTTRKRRTV